LYNGTINIIDPANLSPCSFNAVRCTINSTFSNPTTIIRSGTFEDCEINLTLNESYTLGTISQLFIAGGTFKNCTIKISCRDWRYDSKDDIISSKATIDNTTITIDGTVK
jgi:hypothetical protein